MKAIVTAMIASLHAMPTSTSEVVDEVLYGMTVKRIRDVNEGWVYIQTAYRYEGYCQKADLLVDEVLVSKWEGKHSISFFKVLRMYYSNHVFKVRN